jgi:hypothetical protein
MRIADGKTTLCRFSATTVPASRLGTDRVVCTSPPQLLATQPTIMVAEVSVTANGVDFSVAGNSLPVLRYTYTSAMSVLALSPDTGAATGGTRVLVTGSNLINTTFMVCRFGAAGAVAATHVAFNVVSCISPPHAHGSSEVRTTHTFCKQKPLPNGLVDGLSAPVPDAHMFGVPVRLAACRS